MLPKFPFEFAEDIDKIIKEIRKKTFGSFKHPEIRVEKKPLKEEVFFICTICRREYGPVSKKKWKKILGTVAKASWATSHIADRFVPGSSIPFVVLGGASGLASFILGEPLVEINLGFLPKANQKELEKAKEFLAQCPSCFEWVCKNCWDMNKGVCKICSRKR